jgi:hypothetical protein
LEWYQPLWNLSQQNNINQGWVNFTSAKIWKSGSNLNRR